MGLLNPKIENLLNWLPCYLWQIPKFQREQLVFPFHIILCIVDHFEPFTGKVSFEQAKKRVSAWVEWYPKMADRQVDSDGQMPQHTWFYPPHHNHSFLENLLYLCNKGYGEIEMHLHHNHMAPFPDTAETLQQKIFKFIKG